MYNFVHNFVSYSGNSLNELSEIGTTSIQWINIMALIDSLQELIDQYLSKWTFLTEQLGGGGGGGGGSLQ